MKKINEVTTFIEGAPDPQKEILTTLRELVEAAVPDCEEAFKWSRPIFTTEKDFCYLQFSKKHVNLGFFNFEKLDDPKGLLEGSGKQMRHIKLFSASDIDPEILKSMIAQASDFS